MMPVKTSNMPFSSSQNTAGVVDERPPSQDLVMSSDSSDLPYESGLELTDIPAIPNRERFLDSTKSVKDCLGNALDGLCTEEQCQSQFESLQCHEGSLEISGSDEDSSFQDVDMQTVKCRLSNKVWKIKQLRLQVQIALKELLYSEQEIIETFRPCFDEAPMEFVNAADGVLPWKVPIETVSKTPSPCIDYSTNQSPSNSDDDAGDDFDEKGMSSVPDCFNAYPENCIYTCEHDNFKCENFNAYVNHLRSSHRNISRVQCCFCLKKTPLRNLGQHMQHCHSPKIWKCLKCATTGTYAYMVYSNHGHIMHMGTLLMENIRTGQRVFKKTGKRPKLLEDGGDKYSITPQEQISRPSASSSIKRLPKESCTMSTPPQLKKSNDGNIVTTLPAMPVFSRPIYCDCNTVPGSFTPKLKKNLECHIQQHKDRGKPYALHSDCLNPKEVGAESTTSQMYTNGQPHCNNSTTVTSPMGDKKLFTKNELRTGTSKTSKFIQTDAVRAARKISKRSRRQAKKLKREKFQSKRQERAAKVNLPKKPDIIILNDRHCELKYVISKVQFSCSSPSCDFIGKDSKDWLEHMEKKHSKDTHFCCKHCSTTSSKLTMIGFHLRLHGPVLYKCALCNEYYAYTYAKVEMHAVTKHLGMYNWGPDSVILIRNLRGLATEQDEVEYAAKHEPVPRSQSPDAEAKLVKLPEKLQEPQEPVCKSRLVVKLGTNDVQTFKCEICPHTAFSNSDLQKHWEKNGHFHYRCVECEKKGIKFAEMKDHSKRVHKNYNIYATIKKEKGVITDESENPSAYFQCPNCPAKFLRLPHLRSHVYHENNYKNLQCGHCDFRLSENVDSLNRHIRKLHPRQKLKFTHCKRNVALENKVSKQLEDSYQLANKEMDADDQVHWRVSDYGKSHNCSHCSLHTRSVTNMKAHHARHHATWLPFLCAHCSFVSANKADIRKHIKSDHIQESMKILIRKKQPETSASSTLNMPGMLDKYEIEMGVAEEDTELPCDVCAFTTTERSTFEERQKSHLIESVQLPLQQSNRLPLLSSVCNKYNVCNNIPKIPSTPSDSAIVLAKDALNALPPRTMPILSNKSMTCTICAATNYKKEMNEHLDLHKPAMNDATYSCDHCEFTSSNAQHVNEHRLVQHFTAGSIDLKMLESVSNLEESEAKCSDKRNQSVVPEPHKRRVLTRRHVVKYPQSLSQYKKLWQCGHCNYQSPLSANVFRHYGNRHPQIPRNRRQPRSSTKRPADGHGGIESSTKKLRLPQEFLTCYTSLTESSDGEEGNKDDEISEPTYIKCRINNNYSFLYLPDFQPQIKVLDISRSSKLNLRYLKM